MSRIDNLCLQQINIFLFPADVPQPVCAGKPPVTELARCEYSESICFVEGIIYLIDHYPALFTFPLNQSVAFTTLLIF